MKIIVSYDGTENDQDALALGKVLADAGASLVLAYVRHMRTAGDAERLADTEAEALLEGGATWLGQPDVPRHVVAASTRGAPRPASENADVIAFGSAYRTAPGSVYPQASAERLLDGGRTSIALAPASYRDKAVPIKTVASIAEEGDSSAIHTAESFASRFGAEYHDKPNGGVDLLIVGSAPQTATGQVRVSAAAAYMIELIRCPVIVLPRGVALTL